MSHIFYDGANYQVNGLSLSLYARSKIMLLKRYGELALDADRTIERKIVGGSVSRQNLLWPVAPKSSFARPSKVNQIMSAAQVSRPAKHQNIASYSVIIDH